MQLSEDWQHSRERPEISNYFDKKEYAGLERLGMRILADNTPGDGLAYVLTQLEIPVTDGNIQKLKDFNPHTWQKITGVIFYFENGQVKHRGLYDASKELVRSKWADGLVLEHAITQVPHKFGSLAAFCKREQIREHITPEPKNLTMWDTTPKKEFEH